MACIARHMLFAVGKVGIDVSRHHEHHQGGGLGGLLVVGEIFADMAEHALCAQCGIETSHHLNHLRAIHADQKFQIFRHGRRPSSTTLLSKSTGGNH